MYRNPQKMICRNPKDGFFGSFRRATSEFPQEILRNTQKCLSETPKGPLKNFRILRNPQKRFLSIFKRDLSESRNRIRKRFIAIPRRDSPESLDGFARIVRRDSPKSPEGIRRNPQKGIVGISRRNSPEPPEGIRGNP